MITMQIQFRYPRRGLDEWLIIIPLSDYLRTCLPCPSPLMAALESAKGESPPPPSFLQRREIGGVLPAINRKQCKGCDGRRNGEILICERRIVRNFSNSSR